jgi:hypothetical protein
MGYIRVGLFTSAVDLILGPGSDSPDTREPSKVLALLIVGAAAVLAGNSDQEREVRQAQGGPEALNPESPGHWPLTETGAHLLDYPNEGNFKPSHRVFGGANGYSYPYSYA